MLNITSYNKNIFHNLYKKMPSAITVVIKVNILWYLEELILGGNQFEEVQSCGRREKGHRVTGTLTALLLEPQY